MAADGIIIIDKPEGKSSRWVTNQVSRLFREKKAGHLGTLDPIATGVLPVALGKATRLIRFLEMDDKVYQGIIRLGQATDTQDATGKVIFEGDWSSLDPAQITAAVSTFQGEISQVPPMHSALKREGKPLYKLARKGIEVERKPRRVRVFSAFVEKISLPFITVRVRCAPGTYMRTIAHDLGRKLSCGAHLVSLVRLWNGPFGLEQAVPLQGLTRETAMNHLRPLSECLPHFAKFELSSASATAVKDGLPLRLDSAQKRAAQPGQMCRLLYQGKLIGVGMVVRHGESAVLKPLRVLA